MIAPKPTLAIAAPAKPPIRACEELVGRPKYQVMMSQAMAPIRPARITYSVAAAGTTRPLPIVVATLSGKTNAAMKLKNAAQTTARPGESTRVDTTVAIELAASWKPLKKSKTRATATVVTKRNSGRLTIWNLSSRLRGLDRDAPSKRRHGAATIQPSGCRQGEGRTHGRESSTQLAREDEQRQQASRAPVLPGLRGREAPSGDPRTQTRRSP